MSDKPLFCYPEKPKPADHARAIWIILVRPVLVVLGVILGLAQIALWLLALGSPSGCVEQFPAEGPNFNASQDAKWVSEHPGQCYSQMPGWVMTYALGSMVLAEISLVGAASGAIGYAVGKAYRKKLGEAVEARMEKEYREWHRKALRMGSEQEAKGENGHGNP